MLRVIGISLERCFLSSIADTMNWCQIRLKSLLHQGLSEPELYGDLEYKFKTIMVKTDFSDQFRKRIFLHKRIGYNLNVARVCMLSD